MKKILKQITKCNNSDHIIHWRYSNLYYILSYTVHCKLIKPISYWPIFLFFFFYRMIGWTFSISFGQGGHCVQTSSVWRDAVTNDLVTLRSGHYRGASVSVKSITKCLWRKPWNLNKSFVCVGGCIFKGFTTKWAAAVSMTLSPNLTADQSVEPWPLKTECRHGKPSFCDPLSDLYIVLHIHNHHETMKTW